MQDTRVVRQNPMAAVGHRFAPMQDPLVALEWPYWYWLGHTRAANAIAWGYDVWDWAPISAASSEQDAWHRHGYAAESPERIRWTEAFTRVEIAAASIDTRWRAWEVARLAIPFNSVGILEKYPTSIDSIVALDVNGNPIFSFGPQNGAQATRYSVLHPTPGVGSLEWMWRITIMSEGHNAPNIARAVGFLGELGRDVVEPWQHQSNGSDLSWADEQQIVLPSASIVRMFVLFRGPANRFAVVAGGRMTGFIQQSGHIGAAMRSVQLRSG